MLDFKFTNASSYLQHTIHVSRVSCTFFFLSSDTAAHTTSYGPKCETVTYSWHPSINCSNENDGDKTNKVSPLLCANSENQVIYEYMLKHRICWSVAMVDILPKSNISF